MEIPSIGPMAAVWHVIPCWNKEESGLTLEKICQETGTPSQFSGVVARYLGDFVANGKVEEITCGDEPTRYRRCKQV